MPYLQHAGQNASTMFTDSQRPPAGSHLSAWLHGDSTVVRNHLNGKSKPTGMRKATHTRSATAPVQQLRGGFDNYDAPSTRPRASRLSLVDLMQTSRPAASRTLSTEFYGAPRSRYNSTHPAFAGAAMPPFATGAVQNPLQRSDIKRKHHHRHRRYATAAEEKQQQQQQQQGRRSMCFPSISDRRIRQKSLGTLISGTLLMLVLTIYLALALSATIPTTTFHGVFIFFILVLTIIFAHFLIRLCMLAFGTTPRWQTLKTRTKTTKSISWPSAKKLTISHPQLIPIPRTPRTHRRPVRLLPPYHDEDSLPLPSPSQSFVPAAASAPPIAPPFSPPRPTQPLTSHAPVSPLSSLPSVLQPHSERPLPTPPPPAYGRWRTSIRIDPLHPPADLQQLTRSLAMAEASWISDPSTVSSSSSSDSNPQSGRRARQHQQQQPPSYDDGIVVTSDVYVVGEGPVSLPPPSVRDHRHHEQDRRPVLAPAPLFTGLDRRTSRALRT